MPFELFDPQASCGQVLPLNEMQNRVTFYRIQVFDKSLDQMSYADQMSNAELTRHDELGSARNTRLALPIPTLFPELKDAYGEVRLQKEGEQPIRISLDGTYLPIDPKAQAPVPATPVRVSREKVGKGELKLGNVRVRLTPDDQRLLLTRGRLLYNRPDQVYSLILEQTPPQHSAPLVIDETLEGGKTAVDSDGRTVRPSRLQTGPTLNQTSFVAPRSIDDISDFVPLLIDPDLLDQQVFDEVVGAILADRRSGQTDRGRPSPRLRFDEQPYDLLDREFLELYRQFTRDWRWQKSVIRGGRAPIHGLPALPRYDIGVFSTFEQVWALQGYSRGALVNSITLAPQEELSIEIFSWSKSKSEEERTVGSEMERNTEIGSMGRVSNAVARDLSENTDTSGDVGLGIPLAPAGLPLDVNASTSVSSQVKTGIQGTIDQIHESTRRSTERIKSTQQVKVVQTDESGREDRTIRRIRNANGSRSLTMNYFEVLENFKVVTELKETKRFCVLVDCPDLGAVDPAFIVAYEDRLQRALRSSNYLPGFEAAKKLIAQGWFDGAALIKAEIENAANQSVGAEQAPDLPQKTVLTVAHNLRDVLAKLLNVDLLKAAEVLAKFYNPFDGIDVSDAERTGAEEALGLYNFWFKFKVVSPGMEGKARAYVAAVTDDAPEGLVVEALSALTAGVDDEWLTTLKLVAANLVAIQLASLLLIPFPLLAPVFLELAIVDNNAGLPSLLGKAKQELKTYEVSASVQLPTATVQDVHEIPSKPAPPQLFSLHDLALAHAEFIKLQLHIEANKTYYLNAIWKREDSNSRYERLRLKGLHSYVENHLLGFIGNKAVFPLREAALGEFVAGQLQKQLVDFDPAGTDVVEGKEYPPIHAAESEVWLPTPALYMETIAGRCESLEPYLLERREIEKQLAQAQADLAAERVRHLRAQLDGGNSSTSAIPGTDK